MAKKSNKYILGVALVIALALLYINVPFVDEKPVAAIIILIVALYLLIKG